MQTRSTVMVSNAAVTSSHQLASFHGTNVIKNGGNIFDALITTSSVLSVVQNNLCGLGGDLFALIHTPDGKVLNLNGSGRSSLNANIDAYAKKGLKTIPERGPMAAITVPGIVDAWREINSNYGSMELKNLLSPAIKIAEEGYPLTPKYVASIQGSAKSLGDQKGWKDLFMPDGRSPAAGEIFRQKYLAETLKSVANEGPETFYKGVLMEKIVKGLQEEGCFFTEEDFLKHYSTWDDPLKTTYGGVDVYETYPNSQGATINLWLNLLELNRSEVLSQSDGKSLPLMLETGLKAYRARASYITDPKYHDLPPGFSTMKFSEDLMNLPETEWGVPAGGKDMGDTTYFCLTDNEGNSASVIQSNFMGFGSGVSPAGTGFIMQNRGSYFSLDPQHHNSLQPGKRSFHTLCAAMGIKDNEMSFIAGTMGGDIQPQINVQMINKIVDRDMDVQDILDHPRWAFFGTIYEKPSVLSVEKPLMSELNGVDTKGLSVKEIPAYSSITGHAQAIIFGKKGGIYAGADPRGDGSAVGF